MRRPEHRWRRPQLLGAARLPVAGYFTTGGAGSTVPAPLAGGASTKDCSSFSKRSISRSTLADLLAYDVVADPVAWRKLERRGLGGTDDPALGGID